MDISSGGAHYTSEGPSGYQASKLAVVLFSEFLDPDYGDEALLADSMCPGGVVTDLAQGTPKEVASRLLIHCSVRAIP